MTIFLETERLIIKTPEKDDWVDLYTLQSDPNVMRYIGNGIRTQEEVKMGLDKAIIHQEKHGFSLGSVYEKATGLFIGRAGLIYLAFDDSQPKIEIGYAFCPAFWGFGYATELSKALIEWGFTHLNVNELYGVIKPENHASRKVLEKAGMRYLQRSVYNHNEVVLLCIHK